MMTNFFAKDGKALCCLNQPPLLFGFSGHAGLPLQAPKHLNSLGLDEMLCRMHMPSPSHAKKKAEKSLRLTVAKVCTSTGDSFGRGEPECSVHHPRAAGAAATCGGGRA
mmetsp:Transcript_69075/g.115266  ORF Transcript_69075/g.115266 Transcript_69075/m.115266 type:complete len:109 (+) Transcript_69075:78-404(+)